eukprot:symbB.v1.2.015484.t1/scaffold1083.1/size139395/3
MAEDATMEVAQKFWHLLQVWKYNSFEYSDDPVASAIYLQASFHSHDCNPNATWVADDAGLTLRARRHIAVGEEVTISYLSDEELFESTSQRRMRLKISKDFDCSCPRCCELWDRSRGVRCQCGHIRFLDVAGSMLSPCDPGCNWPSVDEVLRREELLVLLCRQQADEDRATRLASAKTFAAAAEQLLPRHWATECLWKWLAEGCATKLEAKECEAKRLQFLQDAYPGAMQNTHTAWVMSSLAMWTLSSLGALQEPAPPDCRAQVLDSGALELLREAAGLLKNLNGEDDKYFRHVQRNLERVAHLDPTQADHKRMHRGTVVRRICFFSRDAWELPAPEAAPDDWWEKRSSDSRLNVRTIPPEWVQASAPPWPARAGHAALVDPESDAVYILGGEGRDGFMADMWKEAFSINLVNLYNMLELGFLQVTSLFG